MWSSHGLLVFSVFLVPFKIYWNSIVGGLWNFPFFTNNGTNLSHWILIKKLNNKLIANIGKSKCVFTNYFIISILKVLKKNLTSFLRCLSLSRKTKISLSAGILKGLPWETSSSTTEFFFKSRGNTSFLFFFFSHFNINWFGFGKCAWKMNKA